MEPDTCLRLALVLAGAASLTPALAGDHPPRYLKEPLLGLQYDRTATRFEPLPAASLRACPMLADNHNMRSHWYVYAKARGAEGATYYIAGGYSVRTYPAPPDYPRYQLDLQGVVFELQEGSCTVFDDAQNAFSLTPNEAVPPPVLQSLARDHAQRLTHALGGPKRLRKALHRQGIALDSMPAELRQAYRPLASR